jgi:hypothetical protein
VKSEIRGGRGKQWMKSLTKRGRLLAGRTYPHPLFFVSVASKGLSYAVSLLFATLARRFISVAAKGFMGTNFLRESSGLRCEDFGGLRRT